MNPSIIGVRTCTQSRARYQYFSTLLFRQALRQNGGRITLVGFRMRDQAHLVVKEWLGKGNCDNWTIAVWRMLLRADMVPQSFTMTTVAR